MADQKPANPAVVGLAGFGMTTMLLQFHNVGWMSLGPVVWAGLIFGGLAQLVAGFQESKTGNNFGYCAFTGYGCFWISLALLLLGNQFKIYPSTPTDLGWFLVGWTAFTGILWVASLRVSAIHGIIFTLLLLGFVMLDVAHFGYPGLTKAAGYELILCALSAWYLMAHIIFADIFGRDILPVGRPLVGWQGFSANVPVLGSAASAGKP
jgi:succinate-acetate transporter protein